MNEEKNPVSAETETIDPAMFEPLDDSEKNAEFIAVESRTFMRDAWNSFKKNKLALVSLFFLIFMILMAIFVPIISPFTYDGQDMSIALFQLRVGTL